MIDRTEALVAVDVNSGRSTRASSQEETAVGTNLEAANEVARQLRLRDLGGLIVVDFIDMDNRRNQRKVEKAMRDAMKPDKARVTVGRISGNGLLEINRQRIQQALLMRTYRPCPTCDGIGRIASPELVGMRLLHRIEARAAAGFAGRVRIELHPELADALQNNRRHEIAELEREFDLRIEVIASPRLHRSEEEVEWHEKETAKSDRSSAAAAGKAASIQDSAGGKTRGPGKAGAREPQAAAGGATAPRRRSRRRSRGVRKPPPAEGAAADSPKQPAGEAPAAKTAGGEGTPKRRRRRRRRRPRKTTTSPSSYA